MKAENLQAGAAESSGFTQGAWKEALHEYLRTAYKSGGPMCDIESGGAAYKVIEKNSYLIPNREFLLKAECMML